VGGCRRAASVRPRYATESAGEESADAEGAFHVSVPAGQVTTREGTDMKRIFAPTRGVEDWQRLLPEPEKQWRDGYSAKELAKRWEAAGGIPAEVAKLFHDSGVPAFGCIDLLAAFPEWQTELEGKGEASHSDVFIIARTRGELITITVEGKVCERFGPTVNEWLAEAHRGKDRNRRVRLQFLGTTLGVAVEQVGDIRYQLLHRSAAAVIEARRFGAPYAAMVVHSFGAKRKWFGDYEAFVALYGARAGTGGLAKLRDIGGVQLYAGWATGTAP